MVILLLDKDEDYICLGRGGISMIQTLLKTDAYNGHFVAFRDFEHPAVITSGDDLKKSWKKLRKKV